MTIYEKVKSRSVARLVKKDLFDKFVLARVDFNVPIINGKVTDATRVEATQKTIGHLQKNGAKVILLSHLGDEGESLEPVADLLGISLIPSLKTLGEYEKSMDPGEVVLLENIRLEVGEKENEKELAACLAGLADIYVNEAFSASHRKHSSIVGLPKFLPSYFGFSFLSEVENLSKAFEPKHPFTFILGGVKMSTKLPLIKKFLPVTDAIMLGGGSANSVLKAGGLKIGKSVAEEAEGLKALAKNKKVLLPIDGVVTDGKNKRTTIIDGVKTNEGVVDVGPETMKKWGEIIKLSKMVLWNGPLGNTTEGFSASTKAMAKMIAESKAFSILGGGDTLEALTAAKLNKKDFSYISTAGGAMLEFLAKGSLVGIEAVVKK